MQMWADRKSMLSTLTWFTGCGHIIPFWDWHFSIYWKPAPRVVRHVGTCGHEGWCQVHPVRTAEAWEVSCESLPGGAEERSQHWYNWGRRTPRTACSAPGSLEVPEAAGGAGSPNDCFSESQLAAIPPGCTGAVPFHVFKGTGHGFQRRAFIQSLLLTIFLDDVRHGICPVYVQPG